MKLKPESLGFLAILGLMTLPIATYVYRFGTQISGDHTRWAEMGSAMAGIYAPFVGVLTVWILWKQHQLQAQQSKFIKVQHVHNDTTARARFTLDKIENYIRSNDLEDKVTWLNEHNLDELLEARKSYNGGDDLFRDLALLWQSFNIVFAGLDEVDDPYLRMTSKTLPTLAMTQLGVATCYSLDAMAFIAGHDFNYFFRTELGSSLPPQADSK